MCVSLLTALSWHALAAARAEAWQVHLDGRESAGAWSGAWLLRVALGDEVFSGGWVLGISYLTVSHLYSSFFLFFVLFLLLVIFLFLLFVIFLSLIRHLSLRPLSLSLSLLRPLSLSPLSPCFSLFILSPNLLFLRRYLCQSVWYFGIYDERRLHWQFRISYPTCLECRVAERERKRIIREVFIQISSSSFWEKK